MALDNNTVLNYTDKTTIKNWFKTGLKPTQTQFWSTWDSFWHKSESLPISSINGLGGLLDGKAEENHTHSEYATNDATSLTPANVISWQQALGVDDLDYVEIPTENAAENSHPYVVVIDDEGKSAKRNATDFGKVDTIDGIEAGENKNIALGAVRKSESNTVNDDFSMQQENGAFVSIASNGLKVGFGGITATYGTSSISVDNIVPDAAYKFQELLFPKRAVKNIEEKVYPVTYVQGIKADETGRVDISGIAWNYTSPSIRYSGILDKSADATYNQLLGVDSNGYAAKVGLNAVTNAMSKSTDAQKDAWREASRKTGETYSISQARVDAVLPPILLDTNKNITILGINLFLNTTGNVAKVETLHSVTLAVVEVITNISVHQTMPSQLSIEINRELYETDVDYYIRVTHNGIESIVNRSASFIIPSNFNSQPLVLGWKLRTMRSKIEPASYSMTEGQYGSLSLISKGVNNVGQYESGRINAFTDYILTNDEEYVFQINATGWGQQFGSGTWTDDDMFFGITPLETIPENEDTLIHLTNNLIFSGGNSANAIPVGFKLLAVAGTGNTTTQGIAIFFTLIIGKGVMKAIYNNNIIIRDLPTSLTGKYKLFANMSGTSEVTRRIDINITSFYKK